MSTAASATLVLVKPDCMERGLMHVVIRVLEELPVTILGMRTEHQTVEFIRAHYAEHAGKPFFDDLCAFMVSGPVTAILVWGANAQERVREVMMHVREMHAPNEIRRNLVHASDSPEAAARECALWFPMQCL